MTYTQVRPFDTSKGGNIPNLCLDNVRKGYGIQNKYGSAWIAWQHTEQHPDRNFPTGDIPLYYSYVTSIDGITQNYGHINVRLSNGTVWSDGNIYANLDDYLSKKLPKFVGWGESINDFKIIEEEPMPNEGDVHNAYLKANGRKATDEELKVYTSKPWSAADGLYNGKVLVDLVNFKDSSQGTYKPYTGELYEKA